MRDLLLPTTDAGVFAQLAILAVLWMGAIGWAWRREGGTRTVVFGIGFLVLMLMGLRAMH